MSRRQPNVLDAVAHEALHAFVSNGPELAAKLRAFVGKGAAAQRAADFHVHCARCTQCRNNPFALCRTGKRILRRRTA